VIKKMERKNFLSVQRLAYRSREPIWWCTLAAYYATGEGCRQNLRRSRHWYAKAARAGDSQGQYELGYMFMEGEGGPRRMKRGEQLLALAARGGDIDAVKVLLHCYRKGYWGIAPSIRKAEQYRKRYRQLRLEYRKWYDQVRRSDSEQLVRADQSSCPR
jgi:TPR repeat protein